MGDQAGKVSVALPLSYENDLKMEAFPHQNRDDDCHGLMVVHWCIPVNWDAPYDNWGIFH